MAKKGLTSTEQPLPGEGPVNKSGAGKGVLNRSQCIRDYIAQHPKATPKAIKQALLKQGVEVSDGLIGVVKYGKKPKKGASAQRVPQKANGSLSIADLLKVKKLADELGGLDQLRKALGMLEELR